jgi:hypothetical protein
LRLVVLLAFCTICLPFFILARFRIPCKGITPNPSKMNYLERFVLGVAVLRWERWR